MSQTLLEELRAKDEYAVRMALKTIGINPDEWGKAPGSLTIDQFMIDYLDQLFDWDHENPGKTLDTEYVAVSVEFHIGQAVRQLREKVKNRFRPDHNGLDGTFRCEIRHGQTPRTQLLQEIARVLGPIDQRFNEESSFVLKYHNQGSQDPHPSIRYPGFTEAPHHRLYKCIVTNPGMFREIIECDGATYGLITVD